MDNERQIFVVGHQNPDTDSLCSAIAYTYLKNKTAGENFCARRAGRINDETRFVLQQFDVEEPKLLTDVRPQVSDIEMRHIGGVKSNLSLKKAWNLMRELGVNTLPITRNGHLEGLITISDIATSYMDVYDNDILGRAKTQYANIQDTIEGILICGNPHGYVVKGKVLIASTTSSQLKQMLESDDIVITSDSQEIQEYAIMNNASCLIICDGARIDSRIITMANSRDCVVISTKMDMFSVARHMNKSMSIKYFMRKDGLDTFEPDELCDDVKEVMARKRHRDFPIINSNGEYIGMISRRNLLNMKRKQLILVDHNEQSQAVFGIEEAEILEIIDHHRLGSLQTLAPVYFRNQPVGCTATIITQMYEEQGVEIPTQIAGLLCSAIISDTLMFRSPTCTEIDRKIAEKLSQIANIDIHEFAIQMFRAGSHLQNKSAKEIFEQDFKKTAAGDVSFGVGQISSMDKDELHSIKDNILAYMEASISSYQVSMLFFMLTDIDKESTELIFVGENSRFVVEKAFGIQVDESSCLLTNVVSRKKQVIPSLALALTQ